MALVKCKECKKEVSSTAPSCPHCGVTNPGIEVRGNPGTKAPEKPGTKVRDMLLGFAVIIVAIGFGVSKCTTSNSDKAQDAAHSEMDEASCKKDLTCWGEKNVVGASIYCKDAIERTAKYSVKWTDGTLEMKMSRYRWKDLNKGYLTFIGDKAQFQNGFGAYQNVIYECDYDPATKAVLDVHVREGHL